MQRSKKFSGAATASGWRWLRVALPFLVAVAMLVWLLAFSMNILSAVRAFVGGESQWSKAQKEAVFHLNQYAVFRSEVDYKQFQKAMAVPLADQRARLELDKPAPDLKAAREAF